jgi:hypothetical protein
MRLGPLRRVCARACGVSIALAFALPACGDADIVTESYATLPEAISAGAVARGWMPAGLPPATRDLRLAHDLDTSRRWGLFNFEPSEAEALRARLGAELSVQGMECDPPRRIEWWPVVLRGPLDQSQVQATGLRAYQARDGDLVFLVNWNQHRAYYCTRH